MFFTIKARRGGLWLTRKNWQMASSASCYERCYQKPDIKISLPVNSSTADNSGISLGPLGVTCRRTI